MDGPLIGVVVRCLSRTSGKRMACEAVRLSGHSCVGKVCYWPIEVHPPRGRRNCQQISGKQGLALPPR